jgi:CRISPR-associated protein Csm4
MIVYLRPKSPFNKAVPRSDTLFGAIAWTLRVLYGKPVLEALLDRFDAAVRDQRQPPFVLSSLLPYFQDAKGRIRLLPRPLTRPPAALSGDVASYQDMKRARKVDFVSETVFAGIAEGRTTEASLLQEMAKGKASSYRLRHESIVGADEHQRMLALPNLLVESEFARNQINRMAVATGEGGALYYEPTVGSSSAPASEAHGGFYFLVRLGPDEPETPDQLKAAMRFLADRGIGGDSSIGRGHFEVEFDDGANFPIEPSSSETLMTLSLLHPSPRDIAHIAEHSDQTFSRIERRKGFVENSYTGELAQIWKPTLFVLAEGSTFPRDGNRKIYGTVFKESAARPGTDFALRINGLGYTTGLRGGSAQ